MEPKDAMVFDSASVVPAPTITARPTINPTVAATCKVVSPFATGAERVVCAAGAAGAEVLAAADEVLAVGCWTVTFAFPCAPMTNTTRANHEVHAIAGIPKALTSGGSLART